MLFLLAVVGLWTNVQAGFPIEVFSDNTPIEHFFDVFKQPWYSPNSVQTIVDRNSSFRILLAITQTDEPRQVFNKWFQQSSGEFFSSNRFNALHYMLLERTLNNTGSPSFRCLYEHDDQSNLIAYIQGVLDLKPARLYTFWREILDQILDSKYQQALIFASEKIDLSIVTFSGTLTALQVAAFYENEEAVKFLLDKYPLIHENRGPATISDKYSMVYANSWLAYYAALHSHNEVLVSILQRQFYPQLPVFNGNSVLHAAVIGKNIYGLRLAIRYKVLVNSKNNQGQTPLHLAADDKEIVLTLLEAGANSNIRDNDGRSPLMIAAEKNTSHYFDSDQVTILDQFWKAARKGDPIALRSALERKVPINYIFPAEGDNALHICASLGFKNCVDLLLDSGADPEFENDDGKTAAQLAEEHGHVGVAKFIFDFIFRNDKEEEDDLCPICFGKLRNESKPKCGHKFCGRCMKTLLSSKSSCPLCRGPL